MEANKSDLADELQQLLALPMAQRIEAVGKDLLRREDKFRNIDALYLIRAVSV